MAKQCIAHDSSDHAEAVDGKTPDIKVNFFQPYGSPGGAGLMAKISTVPMPGPKAPSSTVERLAPYGSLENSNLTAKAGPVKLSPAGGIDQVAKVQGPAKLFNAEAKGLKVVRLNTGNR